MAAGVRAQEREGARNRILQGDALEVLRTLPDERFHCVVTSPPYWGLRDYGVARQIGLESTLEAYVAKLVEVFREVRRVLRRDGTLWLNLGDSYFNRQNSNRNGAGSSLGGKVRGGGEYRTQKRTSGLLKTKDICGMPWRVAFALQADGWYLRSDIIWSKPNPMPESVADRPTKSHEYLFLMSRSARYFYDADAVKESTTGNAHARGDGVNPKAASVETRSRFRPRQNASFSAAVSRLVNRRHLRSVWHIPTQPFPDAHFATFPERLVEPCIRAGTSEKGCCSECGAPWCRVVANPRVPDRLRNRGSGSKMDYHARQVGSGQRLQDWRNTNPSRTLGWRPSCKCESREPIPCTVLDPFIGSGTTAVVAKKLGRAFIGFELNPEYVKMARQRLRQQASSGGQSAAA